MRTGRVQRFIVVDGKRRKRDDLHQLCRMLEIHPVFSDIDGGRNGAKDVDRKAEGDGRIDIVKVAGTATVQDTRRCLDGLGREDDGRAGHAGGGTLAIDDVV